MAHWGAVALNKQTTTTTTCAEGEAQNFTATTLIRRT